MSIYTFLLMVFALGFAPLRTAAAMWGSECDEEAQRNAKMSAEGITTVYLTVGAGELVIEGTKGTEILVTGEACASNQEALAQIQWKTHQSGDRAHIRAAMPESGLFSGTARLDARVRLPSHLAIEVEDSSGDLEARRVRSAKIHDSSGGIEVQEVAGDLYLRDSSGEMEIRGIGGNVVVELDSSGDIEIENVKGEVRIRQDSSGDIRVAKVGGNVVIDTDSSGDVLIEDVHKSVRVEVDSSGDIEVSQIRGDFTVGADSSGKIIHRGVAGTVEVP